jgi:hypothetical protein
MFSGRKGLVQRIIAISRGGCKVRLAYRGTYRVMSGCLIFAGEDSHSSRS